MRVLFSTSHVFPPQRVGGSERSIDALARGMSARGHAVAVAAGLQPGGALGAWHRLRGRVSRTRPQADRVLGYPVFRCWQPLAELPEVIARWRPDVVVLEGSFLVPRAETARAAGASVVVFLRDCEWHRLGGTPPPAAVYLANSRFTAAAYRERFGIDAAVIPPLVEPRRYQCRPRGRAVVFVNPVPEKGVDVALAVAAANPDIPFLFVHGWPRPAEERSALAARLAALGNVRLVGPLGDMRRAYREAALLLVPSQWQEAWGRVVAEAQVSGIPAVASDRGGLPEAVGSGGLLLPHDAPHAVWSDGVRRVWSDPGLRRRLGEAALRESRSHARDPAWLTELFESALKRALVRPSTIC